VAPLIVLNVPAGQALQLPIDEAPVAPDQNPGEHAVQSGVPVVDAYEPAGQSMQDDAPLVALYVPIGQAVQVADPLNE
jgi:hypothetical protein